MSTVVLRWVCLGAVLAMGGCGDDSADDGTADATVDLDANATDADATTPMMDASLVDGDADIPDAAPPPDPVYVACGGTFAPGGASGFVIGFTSLAAASLDLGASIEVPGGANCVVGDGVVYVGQAESPTLTRYEVGEDGTLTEGLSVSFAGLGIANLGGFPNQFLLISPTKACFLDVQTASVVIWNPSTMEIVDDFPLDGLGSFIRVEGFAASDRFIVYTRNATGTGLTEQRTGIAFVDTTTDTAVFDESTTCGGISSAVELPSGEVFLASNNISAAEHRLGTPGSFPPCYIRIPPGAQAIDDAFSLNANDLTGGPTGGLVPGPGTSGFVQGYDETIVPIDPMGSGRDVQASPAWRLYRIPEVGTTMPGVVVDAVPPAAGGIFHFVIDDRIYLSRLAADFSRATLFDITDAPATITESVSAGGFLLLVDRVR
ncbi:MAG: hypothetical protein AAGF12_16330 [Myxococcota bacterium]